VFFGVSCCFSSVVVVVVFVLFVVVVVVLLGGAVMELELRMVLEASVEFAFHPTIAVGGRSILPFSILSFWRGC